MSEFHVKVVRVGAIEKHPNADQLEVTNVWNYPVIIRTGDFQTGDLAVFYPIDAVLPDTEHWRTILGSSRRVKAKKLRGIFSMGLLGKPPEDAREGDDVRELLGVEKYEAPLECTIGGENEKDPGVIPVYTDIEGFRRWPNLFLPEEEVVLTEKIHGANARYAFVEDKLWVGSHTRFKKDSDTNIWWMAARQYNLEEKLRELPGVAFYGEVFGQVQDLKYGITRGISLRIFDAMNLSERRYVNYDKCIDLCSKIGLDMVPELYRGPWNDSLVDFRNGKSTLAPHTREGFVVKPVIESLAVFDGWHSRKILKFVGEDYHLRKSAK